MPSLNSKATREILTVLAEYQLLTVSQVANLLHLTGRTARRQASDLKQLGFIQSPADHRAGRTGGRPEKVLSLTDAAVEALRSEHILTDRVPRRESDREQHSVRRPSTHAERISNPAGDP